MSLKKRTKQKFNHNMRSTGKSKIDYLLYFIMAAVLIQLGFLVYRIIILTS